MNPYVQDVHPLDDYQLEVVFENGEWTHDRPSVGNRLARIL